MGFNYYALAVLILVATQSVLAAQFCRQRPETQTDFCVASKYVSKADSTNGDLYMSISSRTATGWWAVGIGNHMDGALMFVLYPDTEKEKMIFSTRTAFGHVPPPLAKQAPRIDVIENKIDPVLSFYNITLICRSCSSWSGSDIDFSSSAQPFIWATNSFQDVDPVEDAAVHLHRDYNHFFIDFATDRINKQSSVFDSDGAKGMIPRVHHWGTLHYALVSEENANAQDSSVFSASTLIMLHGSLLALVFGPLFVGGVAAILSRSNNAFRYHWIIQIIGMAIAVIAIMIGVVASSKMPYYNRFRDRHQIVGFLILGMLVLQAFLGWRHHLNFVKLGRRTQVSDGHVWLGRSLLIIGSCNVGWGVYLKTRRLFLPTVWVMVVLLEILCLYMVTNRRKTYVPIPSKESPGDEPSGPYDA